MDWFPSIQSFGPLIKSLPILMMDKRNKPARGSEKVGNLNAKDPCFAG